MRDDNKWDAPLTWTFLLLWSAFMLWVTVGVVKMLV